MSRAIRLAFRLHSRRLCTEVAATNNDESDLKSSEPITVYKSDPAPYFYSQDVQNLLKSVVHPMPEKVFRRRLDGRELEAPEYKFMTDEQLQKTMKQIEFKMWHLLQMPPVVKVREEDVRILSSDPEIQGAIQNKFVFTDITYGISNKNRIIVVREPNGDLRTAYHSERDRLNQIYFPMPGREIEPPKMFQDEYLEPIFEREDYEFILDRSCVQFDPDHPEFHRVTQLTYDRIDEKGHYDKLLSTRHYGPMIFYLAWCKKLDKLLIENLSSDHFEDAINEVKLYYILHPNEEAKKITDDVELIRFYIENDSSPAFKRNLDNSLKMHLELLAERKKIQENINLAHGKTS